MSTYYYELRLPFTSIEKITKDDLIEVILYTKDGKCGKLVFNTEDDFKCFIDAITDDYPVAQRIFKGKDIGSEILILKEPMSSIVISDRYEIMDVKGLITKK